MANFEDMSDDELLNLAKQRKIKVPAPKQRSFEDMSDEELLSAAQQKGIKLPSSKPAPAAPPNKVLQGGVTKTDKSWLDNLGDGVNNLLAPARKAVQEQKSLTPAEQGQVKTAAWGKGLLNVLDIPAALGDIANKAVYDNTIGKALSGKDSISRVLAPMADQFFLDQTGHKQLMRAEGEIDKAYKPVLEKAPNFAGQYQTGVELAAPLPNVSVAKTASLLPKAGKWAGAVERGVGKAVLADAAASGAAVTGLQDVASQYRQTGQVNPLQALGATLAGGVGGGTIGAGGLALSKAAAAASKAAGAIKKWRGGTPPVAPPPPPLPTGEVLPQQRALVDQLLAEGHPDDLEFGSLLQPAPHVAAPPPLETPPPAPVAPEITPPAVPPEIAPPAPQDPALALESLLASKGATKELPPSAPVPALPPHQQLANQLIASRPGLDSFTSIRALVNKRAAEFAAATDVSQPGALEQFAKAIEPELNAEVQKAKDAIKALRGKAIEPPPEPYTERMSETIPQLAYNPLPVTRVKKKSTKEKLLQQGPAAIAAVMASELLNEAHAEDGTDKPKADYKGFLWAGMFLSLAAGGASLKGIHKAKLVQRLGTLWADTHDLIGHLDGLVQVPIAPGAQQSLINGMPQAPTSPGLATRLLGHMAQGQQATWGVHFDNPEQAAEALAHLRSGQITPQDDAIAGAANTPFQQLNQSQRYAIVTQQLIRKRMGRDVANYKAQVDEAVAQGLIDGEAPVTKEAIQALAHLDQTLNAAGKPPSLADELLSTAMGNVMDSFFFWNPQHHLTNLTDQLIGGGSYVGPMNIARANKLLLPGVGDKELMDLMQHSNLTGGLRAERANLQATAAQGPLHRALSNTPVIQAAKKVMNDDFKSDMINADRVAVASLLEFHGLNQSRLTAHPDATAFAKEVLKPNGNIDPTLAMEARVHMTERLMRTLGVDPYRINANILQRSKAGNLFVFAAQPHRIGRLLAHYVDTKNFGAIGTMLGATLLVGGKAAIPSDLGYAWEQFDPNSFFAARKILDQADLYKRIFGQSNSAKLGMAVVPGTMAVPPMAVEMMGSFNESVRKLSKFENFDDIEAQKAMFNVVTTFGKLVGGGVFSGASRELSRWGNEIVEGVNDTKTIWASDPTPLGLGKSTGAMPPKVEITPSEHKVDLLDRLKARILPGEPEAFDLVKQAAMQNKAIGEASERGILPIPDYLPDALKYKTIPEGAKPSSLYDFLRGRLNAK